MIAPVLLILAALPPVYTDQPAPAGETLLKPGSRLQNINTASMTRAAWVDANGWRIMRDPAKSYVYPALANERVGLAIAESYVYGSRAAIPVGQAQKASADEMLGFLKRIDQKPMPAMANILVIDDGSTMMGEILNLLGRRNLAYHAASLPNPAYALNVKVGTPEFPQAAAQNPSDFAQLVRKRIGDKNRLLRIYGSEVVVGHLTGESGKARLHLLNYGTDPVEGIRVRVLGDWKTGGMACSGATEAAPDEEGNFDGALEFGVPKVGVYCVVDLKKR